MMIHSREGRIPKKTVISSVEKLTHHDHEMPQWMIEKEIDDPLFFLLTQQDENLTQNYRESMSNR